MELNRSATVSFSMGRSIQGEVLRYSYILTIPKEVFRKLANRRDPAGECIDVFARPSLCPVHRKVYSELALIRVMLQAEAVKDTQYSLGGIVRESECSFLTNKPFQVVSQGAGKYDRHDSALLVTSIPSSPRAQWRRCSESVDR